MSHPTKLRVYCRTKPDWGMGHVLSDDGGAKVTVFFLGGGKRTLNTTIAELDVVTGKAGMNPILDVAAQTNWKQAHHNRYVIEFNPQVFSPKRTFLEAKLGHIQDVKLGVAIFDGPKSLGGILTELLDQVRIDFYS